MASSGKKVERFSSCRGVSFEIKPKANLFSIPEQNNRNYGSWISWGNSAKDIPSFPNSERTLSGSSNHFCDLENEDDEEEDDDNNVYSISISDIEEGAKQITHPPPHPHPRLFQHAVSKREQNAKPKKKPDRLSVILLDQGLFTVYKRLFLVCFSLNILALILASTGHFPYARNNASLFAIWNIFALTLCRSEAVLRVVFWLVVKLLGHKWVPLRIKTMTTSLLQSLGGIHSSCGVSSIAWLIFALVLTFNDRANTSLEIIGVSTSILSLLCISSLASFPLVRHLHHNVFERSHRFSGWAALVLLWAFILLKISYNPIKKSYTNNIGSTLIKTQEFWFTLSISILIIIPWITVRRVRVDISSPSGHASIIKFEGGIKAGILGRISPSPFSEWHAFGIISDGKEKHMILAGAVGDFTKSLVRTPPPSHLWVRQVHFAGLPYLINMYDKVLLVATGSGICVFLSFLIQPCKANVCLLWVTKGVEQNFGKEIKEMVSGHPKGKVIIHDTALLGRPNVSLLSVDAAKKWGAHVVIVTSNPEGSRDVVDSCKSAGIPAFGPIWDS